MTHYHFIGIGGTGLAPIARVLLEKGHTVSGSDKSASIQTRELQNLGVHVSMGHMPNNIDGADIVIRSSAVKDDNSEIQAALRTKIPVLKRSEFLPHLIGTQKCIAIAGTHGKTTTTAMIAWMLSACGEDPSYVIGGISKDLDSNAHFGKGSYFVIEADEYDYMFYGLSPWLAVVTHVEYDHPDIFLTPAMYEEAFSGFVSRIVLDGTLFAFADDPGSIALLATCPPGRKECSYGFDIEADYRAVEVNENHHGGFTFRVVKTDGNIINDLCTINLKVPGKHNVSNATAAVAIADTLRLPFERVKKAMEEFSGVSRRFDILGEINGITIVDDYAHHPTEIMATLSAAHSKYPQSRIWVVWQPHTYSRTLALKDGFTQAFQQADRLLVTDVYAAREKNSDFSSKTFVEQISHSSARFVKDFGEAKRILLDELRSKDVLLVLSAGDADQISADVLAALKERNVKHGK